jgi:hypothetical protein
MVYDVDQGEGFTRYEMPDTPAGSPQALAVAAHEDWLRQTVKNVPPPVEGDEVEDWTMESLMFDTDSGTVFARYASRGQEALFVIRGL